MTVFYFTTRPTSGPQYTTSVDMAFTAPTDQQRNIAERGVNTAGRPR